MNPAMSHVQPRPQLTPTTPMIVPMVPVVQRPPMVPVFNTNPAAAMLGAQTMLRPSMAGLAIHNQNLAVAALAAQAQQGLAAAVAEKNAQVSITFQIAFPLRKVIGLILIRPHVTFKYLLLPTELNSVVNWFPCLSLNHLPRLYHRILVGVTLELLIE